MTFFSSLLPVPFANENSLSPLVITCVSGRSLSLHPNANAMSDGLEERPAAVTIPALSLLPERRGKIAIDLIRKRDKAGSGNTKKRKKRSAIFHTSTVVTELLYAAANCYILAAKIVPICEPIFQPLKLFR